MALLKSLIKAALSLNFILVTAPVCLGFFGFNQNLGGLIDVGDGFVFNNFEGSSYKFYTVGRTWQRARDICLRDGGDLGVINSPLEERFFAEKLLIVQRYIRAANQRSQAWVGVRRSPQGYWETVFGQFLPESRLHWATIKYDQYHHVTQPDNRSGDEDCASIVFDNSYGAGLNDARCYLKFAFICEKVNNF